MRLINASRLFYYQLPLIERAQIAKYQIESALRFGERIYGLDERLRELNFQYRGLHDPLQYVFEDIERYRYVLVHSHSQPPMSPFLPLAGMTEHELQSLKPEDVKGAAQQDFLRFNRFQSSPSLTRVNLAQTQATQQSQDEAQNISEGSTQQQNTHVASAGSGTSVNSTPQPPAVQTQEQVEDRHWLALKYQTPAGTALAGETYKVTLADGSEIKGVLDEKGEARLDNIVAGNTKVELGEVTPELDALRSEIQHTLNTIIDEREAEAARIEQELNDMGELAATGELVAVGLKSVWSGLTDTLSFLGNALVKTAESAYYLSPAKRLTNLMQAGWQSYQAGELSESDWYAYLANNYQQQDYQDLVELLGFDPKDVDPQVFSQAYEITTLLLTDDETRELFAEFGQAYFASTSSTGWAEVAGGAVFEIVLAALLLVFTAGLGVAAQLAAKAKHADKLKALGTQLQQLGKLLKKKGRTKTLDTQTNKQVIETQALPDGVALKANVTLLSKRAKGRISGHPGIIRSKYSVALSKDHPDKLSAQAELRVGKLLRDEGNDVFYIDDQLHRGQRRAPGKTNDLTLINNGQQVDVKRMTSRNAKDLKKGAEQVGEGGMVVVVRGSTKRSGEQTILTKDELARFVNGFKPQVDGKSINVTYRVLDESELPALKGM